MAGRVPLFDRSCFQTGERFTTIGEGALGGKASGLLRAHELLAERFDPAELPDLVVDIPTLTVITTDFFERFLDRNHLRGMVDANAPDERIAQEFQRGELPTEMIGDLRALVSRVNTPLAVRSSSLLEDALYRPFAGVYGTKMIPNNQPDAGTRFVKLVEAVKLVWASTYFAQARDYLRRAGRTLRDERMAVIVQEVVGARHDTRYYPDISGVARSYNFYRSGGARPEAGVVSLALGLGKTIVDGGRVWSYSPAAPASMPPFASPSELLHETQTEFWAVHLGKPPAYDPLRETEYLTRCGLGHAEADGTLGRLASTYDAGSDRLVVGIGREGARALTFAPILVQGQLPLARVVGRLLAVCEQGLKEQVEIEFALALASEGPSRLGFLQVRPLGLSDERVEISAHESRGEDVLIASDDVMGNGVVDDIRDVVYVRPGSFDPLRTRAVAADLAAWNRDFLDAGQRYVLIGLGRWGSSDPSLGLPVQWSQISAAKAIVEATLPSMNVELSQGSHFFHNLSSFGVSYFCVRHDGEHRLRWDWLEAQPAVKETECLRHVRTQQPLLVKVDGRTGRGIVRIPGGCAG